MPISSGALKAEPTGFLSTLPPDVMAYIELRDGMGDVAGAVRSLEGGSVLHAILRFATPRAFRNEAEIDEWMQRAEAAVESLRSMEFDPGEAFDALFMALTFELAYTGRDVTHLMCAFGDIVVDRVVRPLFPDLSEPLPRRTRGPLRVGFISHSLRNSNAANWALGWLRHMPELETFALNLSPIEDHLTAEFQQAARFYYRLDGPTPAAARFVKSLKLDALIYPDIGLVPRNTQFAAMRLAPVQCTAWGHPVTSGLPTLDYYLSSDLMEPANGQKHYRERLIRLPRTGLTYPRPSLPEKVSRSEFGLPDGFLALMCQNVMKCVPRWDGLFKAVSDSLEHPIVMVGARAPKAQRITEERFRQAGIKVRWVSSMPHDRFLRLQSACDVMLDTPAWNGGNTAIQSLLMGVPTVTLPGEFMRGRHSLAFLQAARAERLVASSPEEYARISTDKDLLASEMRKLEPQALADDPIPANALLDFLWEACRG